MNEQTIQTITNKTLLEMKKTYQEKYNIVVEYGAVSGIIEFHRRNLERVNNEINRRMLIIQNKKNRNNARALLLIGSQDVNSRIYNPLFEPHVVQIIAGYMP